MKLNPLINFCSALAPVSDELLELLLENAIILSVCKNTRLHPNGIGGHNAIFIASGTLRKYAVIENKQITLSLYGENEMIGFTEIANYLEDESLETIHDSELILLPKDFVESLYGKYPEVDKMVRKIFSMKYQKLVYESRLCRLPSADHRYRIFSDANGKYRLPARILASYLVMREETLSRLKTKHKAKNYIKCDV
ncbi:Crp/Fnr family transcriptional regulator [Pedobacter sp. N23S346]|uniref:Crp/Fnr family transcriptional regulator n=1 Tax=Pedobacter sp. N23S346 TaxID=3402750 RepID=UPI003AC54C22